MLLAMVRACVTERHEKRRNEKKMEKFISPKDKTNFVRWILQIAVDNNWTTVFEYSTDDTYKYLIENGNEITLPESARHYYNSDCKLTAFIIHRITENFTNKLMNKLHVLSIHNKNEMVFLIADDFHEECFSCTKEFYYEYYQTLKDLNLIHSNSRD